MLAPRALPKQGEGGGFNVEPEIVLLRQNAALITATIAIDWSRESECRACG
jgi:hypothetical protein